MGKVLIHQVARTTAPPGLRRDRSVREAGRAPDSHLRYDFDTLFYEAVRGRDRVTLVAPKLMNFRTLLKAARYSVDGTAVRAPRIHSFYRHAIAHLSAPAGRVLRLDHPDWSVETQIQPTQLDHLKGLNCEMLISKDNDLHWLAERIAFHTKRCGLEGMCLIDTGSTAYPLEALAEMLQRSDLTRAVLVSMPFPWGGVNRKPMHRELYLQTSAYNLCRIKYLAEARAVVRLDADEVLKPGTMTVFDHAVQARLGFVCFHGDERYPAPHQRPPFQFRDHVWMRPGHEIAGNNWCVAPRGPLGRFQWRCHNLEHNVFHKWHYLEGTWFYHCLGIGTGWKDPNRAVCVDGLTEDPASRRFWQTEFDPVTQGMDQA